jgi:uncharacterized DUF497 family protein
MQQFLTCLVIVYTIIIVEIEYDPVKRHNTLINRRLDFDRCLEVFSGPVLEIEDSRFDYDEMRYITFGLLDVSNSHFETITANDTG